MAILALVALAACTFAAGTCFGGGASDWADAETEWKIVIDRTTRKRAGPLTILFLKEFLRTWKPAWHRKSENDAASSIGAAYFTFAGNTKQSYGQLWGLREKSQRLCE